MICDLWAGIAIIWKTFRVCFLKAFFLTTCYNILDLIDMGDSDVIIAGLRKEKGYTQSQLKNPISYSELYSPNQ